LRQRSTLEVTIRVATRGSPLDELAQADLVSAQQNKNPLLCRALPENP
jgi:hypothetical protein